MERKRDQQACTCIHIYFCCVRIYTKPLGLVVILVNTIHKIKYT